MQRFSFPENPKIAPGLQGFGLLFASPIAKCGGEYSKMPILRGGNGY
jgi:hypothetical protein